MEFADILKRRRMVRHFRTDPVPHEALARIGAAAQRAPSAGFSQGQRLVIVTRPEVIQELGIPGDFTPVGVIPVGWPLDDKPSPSLKGGKVKPGDFVRWEHW